MTSHFGLTYFEIGAFRASISNRCEENGTLLTEPVDLTVRVFKRNTQAEVRQRDEVMLMERRGGVDDSK